MAWIRHGGEVHELAAGKTIFDFADELAVRVPSSCGRQGSCHECVVEVKAGARALEPPTAPESFLRSPFRLACQARVADASEDIEFTLLERHPKILTATRGAAPAGIDPPVVRRGDKVWYEDEPLDDYRGRMLGIAMDFGTTTVVFELIDLETGQGLYLDTFENPQRFGGSDIMHRISYDGGAHRGELHQAAVNALNGEIREMCGRLGVDRNQIYEVVVAGNSTMRDLFFGLDVQSIGQRPYQSRTEREYLDGRRTTTALVEPAHRLGVLAHPKARVYGPPLVASHVGADITAGLAAIDIESQHDPILFVDIGTNTEVVAGHAGRLVAASCPAGPAFEGGGIRCGMAGVEGAIESLEWTAGGWRFRTIGDGPPRGVCGSGLIDLLAHLRRHGRMTEKGVFQDRAREIPIVPEHGLAISREDVSNLAQAKAANYCGQNIVLRSLGVSPGRIARLYLAGGFANYVDVRNAIEIGFLAPVPEERIVKAGNASLEGARRLLLSRSRRVSIETTLRRIEHVELELEPDFFEIFVEGCQFKPMPG